MRLKRTINLEEKLRGENMGRYLARAISIILLIHAQSVVAANAPELNVKHAVVIDAPAEKVWEIVSDFGGLHRWLVFIEDTKIILGKNREQGAIRLLTRRNGTKVEERLVEYDPYRMTASYTYVQGQPLSSDYYSTMTVLGLDDGRSQVEWKATFKRLHYWMDTPPIGKDDETLVKILNKVYSVGLQAMKEKIESGIL
ncbi:MAG: hypothetical protein CBB82_02880 [Betaproteobacteria bacterium TMED22]|nr:MAG: hypothetical protein CBB82_02880 [Betaproteobacteria bacterium TMED22]|tara:strand:- start:388 stop:981 length:594 start_codon:yes stop_codon:yes gene_type:complete